MYILLLRCVDADLVEKKLAKERVWWMSRKVRKERRIWKWNDLSFRGFGELSQLSASGVYALIYWDRDASVWGQTSRAALFVRYFFSLRDKETSLKLGNAYLSCLELDFFFVVVFIFLFKGKLLAQTC